MAWAIIGGSAALGLAASLTPVDAPASRYGAPSATPLCGRVAGQSVMFLPRHGSPHRIAPHLVNYRANVDVLRTMGAAGVIALNTVGGITRTAQTGSIVIPDQIIDYTWGREHSFSDAGTLIHADFAEPLDERLRRALAAAAAAAGVAVISGGVYGATQGPRFETAAEIRRMARDGCDLVGMTGMPEAALACEAGMPYAMLSLVVNPAAGIAADPFDMAAIAEVAAAGMSQVERLLLAFFERPLQGGEGR